MAFRAFMNSTGFKVSKPGFTVDITSEANLLFSSSSSSMVQYITGLVAPSGFGGIIDQYRTATVNFGKTYAQPPLCFFAAMMPNGRANTSIGLLTAGDFSFPNLYGQVSTTKLDLYIDKDYDTLLTAFRYYVLENTIQ